MVEMVEMVEMAGEIVLSIFSMNTINLF